MDIDRWYRWKSHVDNVYEFVRIFMKMALFAKTEGFRRVPWFSLAEWHQVYKQIYSNDTTQQMKGYEILLVWKARMPKLPVGVECTLSLIQVCLRDHELVSKIESGEAPIYHENDLSLMYSTAIMRFLNQISNIGHTKQTSLFQIAKQLKIPEWIVNLRHDAAHGHELPAIGLLRMAANMLLTWLHDEYWTAEGQAFEEQYTRESEMIETEDIESSQTLIDLCELWMAVGLYIKAGYSLVSDLPDDDLQETLNELKAHTKKSYRYSNAEVSVEDNYRLTSARSYILMEISRLLSRNKASFDKNEILINTLLDSEVFLPSSGFFEFFLCKLDSMDDCEARTHLPPAMIKFWENFLQMLHEKKLLESLTLKLLEFVNSLNEDKHKRLCAALWINSIVEGLIKLKITHDNTQKLEHSCSENSKRMTPKLMKRKLREKIHSENPEFDNALWLNMTEEIPPMFVDINFIRDIALNPNEYTIKFFKSMLDLVGPCIEEKNKQHLLQLVSIYTMHSVIPNGDSESNTIYTLKDFERICNNHSPEDSCYETEQHEDESNESNIADKTVRNNDWELAPMNYDWETSAFGILPWQIDSLEILHSTDILPKVRCPESISNIAPGFVDYKRLMSNSQVNWEAILRKKQRTKKKKQMGDADIMMNRAIEEVKIRKM